MFLVLLIGRRLSRNSRENNKKLCGRGYSANNQRFTTLGRPSWNFVEVFWVWPLESRPFFRILNYLMMLGVGRSL